MATASVLLKWFLTINLLQSFSAIVAGTIDLTEQRTSTTSHWTVTSTVSIERENQKSSPRQEPQSASILVLHWICFANASHYHFSSDDSVSCCNAIHNAMLQQQRQLHWIMSWQSPDDDEMTDFVRYCQRKQAVIPATVRSFILEPSDAAHAIFSLVISYNHVLQNPLMRNDPLMSSMLVHNPQMVHSFWTPDHHGSRLVLPASLVSSVHGNKSGDLQHQTETQQSPHHEPRCEINSHLSETGGMHRTMRHRISCNDSPFSTQASPPQHGRIGVVLWVPHDMWLDINDAFSNHHDTCHCVSCSNANVTCRAEIADDQNFQKGMKGGKNVALVMDIEDTAFDSPQHVILLHVDFVLHAHAAEPPTSLLSSTSNSGTKESKTFFVLEVLNKLHLRYPQPVNRRHRYNVSNSLTVQRWRTVVFPAPSIFQISLDDTATSFHLVKHTSPLVVTFVAAAYDDDYFWVAAATMACNVVGAMLLLREILRVAQWT